MNETKTELVGQEVSCVVVSLLLQEIEKKGLPPQVLTSGVTYPLAHLRNQRERIDWDSFRIIMANAGQVWEDEEIVALGRAILSFSLINALMMIARLLYSTADFFRWLFDSNPRYFKQFVTCIDTRLYQISPNHLELQATMHEEYRPCREIFLLAKGVFIAVPTYLGLKPARVEIEISGDSANYSIHMPTTGGALAWLRKALTWPFTARAVARELKATNEILYSRYQELLAEVDERKRIEAKLEEQANLLQLILDNIGDGVVVADETGKFIVFNPAAEKLVGMGPTRTSLEEWSEHYGVFYNDGMTPLPTDKLPMVRAMRGESVDNVETFIRNAQVPQGLHARNTIRPLMDKDGCIKGGIVVFNDITERKESEAALRESETRFRTLAETTDAAIFIYRRDKNVYANPAAIQITGYSEAEILQMNFWDIMHPDFQQIVKDRGQRRLSGENVITRYEIKILTKDGQTRWLDVSGNTMEFRGETAVIGTAFDITERKQAEEALVASNQFLEVTQSVARVGSWDFDPETETGHWSSEMFRVYERDPASGPPNSEEFLNMVHPEDREKVITAQNEALQQTQYPTDIDFRILLPDGRIKHINAKTYFTYQEGKPGPKLIGTAQDITERKGVEDEIRRLNEDLERRVAERTAELEERVNEVEKLNEAMAELMSDLQAANDNLTQTTHQLQQANAELETFTYSVAHDLKAPLRGIDGYSAWLLEEYHSQLDERGQHYLGTIRRAVNRMHKLIDDLLTYSRLERRQMTLTDIPLQPLINNLLSEREHDIQLRQVDLIVNIPQTTISADFASLNQALRNLIDNAIKFTRDRTRPVIEISASKSDGKCVLWVKDNGIGFDMQYYDQIFSIFQRLHKADEYPGTGIGLAIVSKAMQRMGGKVWAESEPGNGATFFLQFRSKN